ncbi:MAG: type II secretion system F family protein [Gemmataceae bacterium]|nr:type II secretion system F family protein [Gemmataceae bacterium]
MSTEPDPSPPTENEQAIRASDPGPAAPGGPLSAEDLIALNEEIAGMARAGLPLDQGLSALAREMGRGRLRNVTKQLGDDLRAGFTLPQALERQKGRVPAYYAALLAAGIRSGRLPEVLATLTLYARSLADFRSAVVSALIYPMIVLVLSLGLLVFISALVLPGLMDTFNRMQIKLPGMTQVLIFVGEHALEILVLPVVVLVVVLALARWWLRRSGRGRVLWARLVYSLPLAGTLVRSARLAAFTDLLGILVDQKVPLPEALRLAGEASSDPLLTEGVKQIEADLNQGLPLGEIFKRQKLVPELVVWMTRFGEKRGTLGSALNHVAQMYRRQAETRAALLRSLLPPLLVLIVALFLGALFILGLMAPTYNLLEGLGGGKKQ